MKKSDGDDLLQLVESYFNGYLQRARGASPHTVRAYGHALRLLFLFLAKRVRRPVERLRVDDIRVDTVLAFLKRHATTRLRRATVGSPRSAASSATCSETT